MAKNVILPILLRLSPNLQLPYNKTLQGTQETDKHKVPLSMPGRNSCHPDSEADVMIFAAGFPSLANRHAFTHIEHHGSLIIRQACTAASDGTWRSDSEKLECINERPYACKTLKGLVMKPKLIQLQFVVPNLCIIQTLEQNFELSVK